MGVIDFILCLVILTAVFFAARAVVRARKNGGCAGCSGDCSACGTAQNKRKKQ